jgi:hypothetical protein
MRAPFLDAHTLMSSQALNSRVVRASSSKSYATLMDTEDLASVVHHRPKSGLLRAPVP